MVSFDEGVGLVFTAIAVALATALEFKFASAGGARDAAFEAAAVYAVAALGAVWARRRSANLAIACACKVAALIAAAVSIALVVGPAGGARSMRGLLLIGAGVLGGVPLLASVITARSDPSRGGVGGISILVAIALFVGFLPTSIAFRLLHIAPVERPVTFCSWSLAGGFVFFASILVAAIVRAGRRHALASKSPPPPEPAPDPPRSDDPPFQLG